MNDEILINFFQQQHYQFQVHLHEPVFKVDQNDNLSEIIMGAHSKNLFLKDKRKYYLVSVLEHKRVDLKQLSINLQSGRFSFGNPQELLDKLNVTPGSVTPYGLINDIKKEVDFFLDNDFLNYELVNFHPLRNDKTVSMALPSFLDFFNRIGHAPKLIDIPIL